MVVGAAGLWGAAPGLADPTAILAFLAIALIGAEYTGVFTNRNLSTTLRHRRFLFSDSFLLLWKWRVG